jgi:hypothetical protein
VKSFYKLNPDYALGFVRRAVSAIKIHYMVIDCPVFRFLENEVEVSGGIIQVIINCMRKIQIII